MFINYFGTFFKMYHKLFWTLIRLFVFISNQYNISIWKRNIDFMCSNNVNSCTRNYIYILKYYTQFRDYSFCEKLDQLWIWCYWYNIIFKRPYTIWYMYIAKPFFVLLRHFVSNYNSLGTVATAFVRKKMLVFPIVIED